MTNRAHCPRPEMTLRQLIDLANLYRDKWLLQRVCHEEASVRVAEDKAVSRFAQSVEIREDKGADLVGAWYYLVNRVRNQENPADWGLLETSLVCDVHRVLFGKTTLPSGKTPPGQLSDRPRFTDVAGRKRHWYPRPTDMSVALATVLDIYNAKYDSCRGMYDVELFRSSAWLICHFLALHPFGDGNGRLCHILFSYAMAEYQPFPVPVCEVNNYLAILLDAQETGEIDSLAACVARGTCCAWESFFGFLYKEKRT